MEDTDYQNAWDIILGGDSFFYYGICDGDVENTHEGMPHSKLVEYLQGLGIQSENVEVYMRCIHATIGLLGLVNHQETLARSTVLALYRMYHTFTNLTHEEVSTIIVGCTRAIEQVVYEYEYEADEIVHIQHAWKYMHRCGQPWLDGDICDECECGQDMDRVLRGIENALMDRHNSGIAPLGDVWEEEVDRSMLLWLPREMMEDVVDMGEGARPDTRIVRV